MRRINIVIKYNIDLILLVKIKSIKFYLLISFFFSFYLALYYIIRIKITSFLIVIVYRFFRIRRLFDLYNRYIYYKYIYRRGKYRGSTRGRYTPRIETR